MNATTTKATAPHVRDRAATAPATLELYKLARLLERTAARVRRYRDAHPTGCPCTTCRASHPELADALTGLEVTLDVYRREIDMDRPAAAAEFEFTVEQLQAMLAEIGEPSA